MDDDFRILFDYVEQMKRELQDEADLQTKSGEDEEKKCVHESIETEEAYVCCKCGLVLEDIFQPDIHWCDHALMPRIYGGADRLNAIDLLSKYLGTRVFDWPRGNFHLARSPLYRERSGKLEVFQRQRLKTGGRQLKTYPCRTVSVGGFRKNFCTLFDCSSVLFFSTFPTCRRGSLCCGESLSKGAT